LESLDAITYSASKIETFAKFTLRNVRRDNRNRKEISLNTVVTQIFQYFEKSLLEKNIKVVLELQEKLPYILAFQIDWESIIVNFITNAVWAMEDKPSDQRLIRVTTKVENGVIHFSFSDSGIGIETGTQERIFLPTFSTRRNEEGLIIGTGMGLAIVKGFVDAFPGGRIDVVSPCDIGGAQFNIYVQSVEVSEAKTNGQEEDLAD
jgi:signal transduction histidine kinase